MSTHPFQLPCGHEYCKSCVAQLREKGVAQTCPLCRKPLPPGLDKLYDLGYRKYEKIRGAVNRSRPGVRPETPWPALSDEQQHDMDQAVAMLREAADQGHMQAPACCGDIYAFGHGVAKDDRLSFVYCERAAQQGDLRCQYNTGLNYRDGHGCEQSFVWAVEWWEKAAGQGYAHAISSLGALYHKGQGVPQSYAQAKQWWEKAAGLGHVGAMSNLGSLYCNGHGVPQSCAQAADWWEKAAGHGDT